MNMKNVRIRIACRFTLVELLIVVAVLLILVAMLLPALERARYSAQLTVCAVNQRELGVGLFTGAANYDRKYPTRVLGDGGNIASSELKYSGNDDRPELKKYLGQDLFDLVFTDPLVTQPADYNTLSNAYVQTTLSMYWHWRITTETTWMRRLGDRWTYQGKTYNVLATDLDQIGTGTNVRAWAAHPDFGTRTMKLVASNQSGASGVGTTRYQLAGSYLRGPIDVNVLFDDGSVRRYANRGPDDTTNGFNRIRVHPTNSYPDQYCYAPEM